MGTKVRHYTPPDSNKTSCDSVIGKKMNKTSIKCLITCDDCKNKLGIPLDFIDRKLVE